jgi:D-arabinose 1-dehydrogenase-like Zn-dependent alcohol dehydrogenase
MTMNVIGYAAASAKADLSLYNFVRRDARDDDVVIKIQEVNEAYKRMLKSDVKYRFVIDMDSLKARG